MRNNPIVMVQASVLPNGLVIERHYSASRNPQPRAQQSRPSGNQLPNIFSGFGNIFNASDVDAFFGGGRLRPSRPTRNDFDTQQENPNLRRNHRAQGQQRQSSNMMANDNPMAGFMDLFGIMNHPFLRPNQQRESRNISFGGPNRGRMIIISSNSGDNDDDELAQHQSFMRSHQGEVLNQNFINSLLAALLRSEEEGNPPPRAMNRNELTGLKVTKYKKTVQKPGEEEEKCPICCMELENSVEVKALPCKHIFHPGCIDTWLVRNCTCPICKRDVKDLLEDRSPN